MTKKTALTSSQYYNMPHNSSWEEKGGKSNNLELLPMISGRASEPFMEIIFKFYL